ncbi:uncharacterized protein LOC120330887 isoform X2 [Styela clava]
MGRSTWLKTHFINFFLSMRSSGAASARIPLVFVLMSRRRKIDYVHIFNVINNLLTLSFSGARVKRFVLDFEAATWQALSSVWLDVEKQGCSFHFTHAIMKNVRHNNLARLYNKDAGTRDLIKHVMALCYIAAMFITSRFKSLKEKMHTQDLKNFAEYFQNTWLYNSVWTPKDCLISTMYEVSIGIEADVVDILEENVVGRVNGRYAEANERVQHVWEQFKEGELSVDSLFRRCSRIYGPQYCKEKIDYVHIFNVINNLLTLSFSGARAKRFVLDFEAATWQALSSVWPDVEKQGCSFHFTQAIMKNVRHNNLARQYNKDAGTRDLIKHVMALCYIPTMFITPRFKSLKEKMHTQDLKNFAEYFQNTWLYNSVWTPKDWSVFDVEIRTNNHLEGWHRHFNSITRKNMPFYSLISTMYEVSIGIEADVVDILEENVVGRVNGRHVEANERVQHVWEQFKEGELSVDSLLRRCSRIYGPQYCKE